MSENPYEPPSVQDVSLGSSKRLPWHWLGAVIVVLIMGLVIWNGIQNG